MAIDNKAVRAVAAFHLLALAGCAAGPDFNPPAQPAVTGYTSTPLAAKLDISPTNLGDPQSIVEGKGVRKQWWRELGSKELDLLVGAALERNPDLKAAEATLRQARELEAARGGSTLFPQVEGALGVQRRRFNPGALGQPGGARDFTLYDAGLGVRYNFDLAGGNRRALEALSARSDYQQRRLEGARLALAAQVVTTAINQAALRRELEVVESTLKAQENQLELTRHRIALGHGEPDDESTLLAELEQTRARLPLLRNLMQQNEHLLAVLGGKAPGEGPLPSFALSDFTLPPELPLLIPSELVRARPDILGAEALLQAANAEYGVAISKLYPQLNLSADLGSQALTAGALFGSGSAIWTLVGQLTQPLFNPGLPAEKRAALAAFDAAAANYQSIVLEALRNVADVLRALENDARRLQSLAAADAASARSLESTRRRYELGAVSYYDLLAEQQRLQTELDLAEGQARRLINSAAFFQAMGGGL